MDEKDRLKSVFEEKLMNQSQYLLDEDADKTPEKAEADNGTQSELEMDAAGYIMEVASPEH